MADDDTPKPTLIGRPNDESYPDADAFCTMSRIIHQLLDDLSPEATPNDSPRAMQVQICVTGLGAVDATLSETPVPGAYRMIILGQNKDSTRQHLEIFCTAAQIVWIARARPDLTALARQMERSQIIRPG